MPVKKPVAPPKPVRVDSPRRRRLPPLLRRAWFGLNQAFRRRIAHLRLTPNQFTMLRTLGENNGATQCELAYLMSSDPNTIASLLERMEKLGWVERQTHEKDRRANHLRLKPAGLRKFEEARGAAVGLQLKVLGALPEKSREKFLEDLEKIGGACRAAAGEPPKRQK